MFLILDYSVNSCKTCQNYNKKREIYVVTNIVTFTYLFRSEFCIVLAPTREITCSLIQPWWQTEGRGVEHMVINSKIAQHSLGIIGTAECKIVTILPDITN